MTRKNAKSLHRQRGRPRLGPDPHMRLTVVLTEAQGKFLVEQARLKRWSLNEVMRWAVEELMMKGNSMAGKSIEGKGETP